MSAANKPTDPRILSAERLRIAKDEGWDGALLAHIDALTDQLAEAAKREQALRAALEAAREFAESLTGGRECGDCRQPWADLQGHADDCRIAPLLIATDAALETSSGSTSSDNGG